MIKCYNLDTHQWLYFTARTPYEAMEKLLYTLNLKRKDTSAKIQLIGGGRTLSITHNGETWSCLNK